MQYTGDIQDYRSCSPTNMDSLPDQLSACVGDIGKWTGAAKDGILFSLKHTNHANKRNMPWQDP